MTAIQNEVADGTEENTVTQNVKSAIKTEVDALLSRRASAEKHSKLRQCRPTSSRKLTVRSGVTVSFSPPERVEPCNEYCECRCHAIETVQQYTKRQRTVDKDNAEWYFVTKCPGCNRRWSANAFADGPDDWACTCGTRLVGIIFDGKYDPQDFTGYVDPVPVMETELAFSLAKKSKLYNEIYARMDLDYAEGATASEKDELRKNGRQAEAEYDAFFDALDGAIQKWPLKKLYKEVEKVGFKVVSTGRNRVVWADASIDVWW